MGISSGIVPETREHQASYPLQYIVFNLTCIVQPRQMWNEVGDSYILPQFDLSSTRCSLSKVYKLNRELVLAMLTDLLTNPCWFLRAADWVKD